MNIPDPREHVDPQGFLAPTLVSERESERLLQGALRLVDIQSPDAPIETN